MAQSIKNLLSDEQVMNLTPGDIERLKTYGYSTEGLMDEPASTFDRNRSVLDLDRGASRLAQTTEMERWARSVERYEIPPLPERADVIINGYRFSIPAWTRGIKVPLSVIEILEESALSQQKLALLSAMYQARQNKPLGEAGDLPHVEPRALTPLEVKAGVTRELPAQE